MRMLPELHNFAHCASVRCPSVSDWSHSVLTIEQWLNQFVGSHHKVWAWHTSACLYELGVAFRWQQHKLLFVMRWA